MEEKRKIHDGINHISDIRLFTKKEGLIIFPISMNRISNSQAGKEYSQYLDFFTTKRSRGNVGVTFLYTDNLYEKYNQIEKPKANKSFELILNHKNQFIKKLRQTIYAENAFDFVTWMQLLIQAENFSHLLARTKELYKKDKKFQQYVKEDIRKTGRKVTQNFVDFILEETLLSYLILKHEIGIPNKYTNGRDKWRLIAYPGKPNKSMIYFFQQNPFNRQSQNPYQNGQYDLDSKKFYDFDKINLETLKL